MICPYCRHDNIEGADQCASCQMDLQPLGLPSAETLLEDRLINEEVAKLGAKQPVMVEPTATLRDAIDLMVGRGIGCVLVHDGRRVVGILTERDLLLRVGSALPALEQQPVSRFMTPDPVTLDCEAPLAYALNEMTARDFRHLPLTRGGDLAGIISLRDFLDLLFRTCPDIARETASGPPA